MLVPVLVSNLASCRQGLRVARLLPVLLFSLLQSSYAIALPPKDATTVARSNPVLSYQQLPALNQQPARNGGPALLLLFGPDCRFCKQQARLMAQLQVQCPAAQLALIGVTGARADLQQEIRQLKTPLPAYLADPAFLRAIAGVQAVPTSLVLDADGRLLLKRRGMLNASQLTQLSQSLLAPDCQVALQPH